MQRLTTRHRCACCRTEYADGGIDGLQFIGFQAAIRRGRNPVEATELRNCPCGNTLCFDVRLRPTEYDDYLLRRAIARADAECPLTFEAAKSLLGLSESATRRAIRKMLNAGEIRRIHPGEFIAATA